MKTEQELDLSGFRELLEQCGHDWTKWPIGSLTPVFEQFPALLSRTEQAEAERDALKALYEHSCAVQAECKDDVEAAESSLKERNEEVERLRAAMQKAVDEIAHLFENRARLTLEVALEPVSLSHQGGKA